MQHGRCCVAILAHPWPESLRTFSISPCYDSQKDTDLGSLVPRNVAYGGLGIFVVTVMVLVMREAYTVVQIQKKQERDLLKQKEIDKKCSSIQKCT